MLIFGLRAVSTVPDVREIKRLCSFKLAIAFLWGAAFYGFSNILSAYESILNHAGTLTISQILLTGAAPGQFINSFNVFNEGPIGYFIMACMVAAGCMFVKELTGFQKFLHSLSHNENNFNGGELLK